MLERWEGLTATYNRFHDPDEGADDIARLRTLHTEMDSPWPLAYGWQDLDSATASTKRSRASATRSARRRCQVLARLLALNHERYAEEVRAGLHEKKNQSDPPRIEGDPKTKGLFD